MVVGRLRRDEELRTDLLRPQAGQQQPDDLPLSFRDPEGRDEVVRQLFFLRVGGPVQVPQPEGDGEAVEHEEVEGLGQVLQEPEHREERQQRHGRVDQHEGEEADGERDEHRERAAQRGLADPAQVPGDEGEAVHDHREEHAAQEDRRGRPPRKRHVGESRETDQGIDREEHDPLGPREGEVDQRVVERGARGDEEHSPRGMENPHDASRLDAPVQGRDRRVHVREETEKDEVQREQEVPVLPDHGLPVALPDHEGLAHRRGACQKREEVECHREMAHALHPCAVPLRHLRQNALVVVLAGDGVERDKDNTDHDEFSRRTKRY